MRTNPDALNSARIVWSDRAINGPEFTAEPDGEMSAVTVWLEQWRADRVRVVSRVDGDLIVDAWAVSSIGNELAAPEGRVRRLNRATFNVYSDPRLEHLFDRPLGVEVTRKNGRETLSLDNLPPYEGPRWTEEISGWPIYDT